MRMLRVIAGRALLGGVFLTSGCSAQLGGLVTSHSPGNSFPIAATAGMQAQRVRQDATYLGARTTFVQRSTQQAILLRSAIVSVGYDWHVRPEWGRFGFEAGLDFGGGAPAFHAFDGVGVYGGVLFAPRYRLPWPIAWDEDQAPGYHVLGKYADVVLALRGGAWSGPEGTPDHAIYGEFSGELALRFSIFSDAVNSRPQLKTP